MRGFRPLVRTRSKVVPHDPQTSTSTSPPAELLVITVAARGLRGFGRPAASIFAIA
jgi:hypothetical protein